MTTAIATPTEVFNLTHDNILILDGKPLPEDLQDVMRTFVRGMYVDAEELRAKIQKGE